MPRLRLPRVVIAFQNTPICVGDPERLVLRPDRQEPHRVAEPCRRPLRPRPETPAGSTRSGGRGGGTVRPASVSHVTLYSRFGVVSTTVRGRANSNSTRSNADSRGGSRCSMTSTTAAASKPSSRLSRYISEPWISLIRFACRSGSRSSFSRSLGRLPASGSTRPGRRSPRTAGP